MTVESSEVPTLEDVRAAARRIEAYAIRTPVLTSTTFNELTGASLYFKCENFQKAGAFKFRGACNAVLCLSDEEAGRGVVTHSSGNHAQALALAARIRGIPARIVMPDNAAAVKQAAVAGYGAEITLCPPTLADRERTTEEILSDTGATLIHPYNDYRIIAGQGTAVLELLEEIPGLDVVITPVGGGGLLSGAGIAVKGISPSTEVIGAEPEGADDAKRSLESGEIVPSNDPRTIADGLLTALGTRTFPIIQKHVREIVTVSEASIVDAMRFVWERMKLVVEPSAAVPVAALLEGKIDAQGKRIGIVLSGGNVDLDRLPWIE